MIALNVFFWALAVTAAVIALWVIFCTVLAAVALFKPRGKVAKAMRS
jgi:hypothetical protein